MKKYYIYLLLPVLFVLVSWGRIGHQAVGLIAENHLTEQAKREVRLLLGGQLLGDVASWADDVIDEKTFPQHFINVPLGLSRAELEAEVKNQPQDNVYKAILAKKALLKSDTASAEERSKALKFIIHFVGDLHQPFHVSRKEDQGGNTIKLKFEDQELNLHTLWDSRLINKQGLNAQQITQQFDKATPAEIKQWQTDTLMDWIWESYQLSTKLYETSQPGAELGDAYYKANINTVDKRIEQAGIRLAGLLNEVYGSN